ncbi:MAG: penicillin acylase family protein, partial [Balneolaceae bacterium]|nr:penicillin acylase family protein [Balneolaceae bacterium]
MAKKISLLATVLFAVITWFIYSTALGPLPPVGQFFHPSTGFWANAETVKVSGELHLTVDGLQQPVDVFFDDRGVPHIFAENDHDLYFAQGYVTARDRLFQMELQIRAAGGFLAEWLGDDLISYDRHQRRLGMLYGAEQAMEEIGRDELISGVLDAYAAGVNAYIATLHYEKFPVEYKVLGVEPQQWEPLHTALLLKYMTQMLAGRNSAVETSNTIAYLGEEFANRYLSKRPDLMDPIIPPGTEWDFEPIPTERPDTLYQPRFTEQIEPWKPHPFNGSNNWVVDGTKTAAGYPILANDMHLNMSAPAIWYEVQLHTPDQNVYGVTLQGTPTVIVGFNEYIAWGSTNTGADVMDWLEITFRDEKKSEYLYDGEWLPVETRIETIYTKSGEAVTDTILFTHHGPVYESVRETPINEINQKDLALRWIAHEPSNELRTFYLLNRAQNYDDFREAFRTYQAPAQNMNYAGIDGNIAIQTGGKFPVKWQFQGRTVGDGSDPLYDWTEFIPYEQNPYSLNPDRGFLSAANQYPADVDYPYYLGDDFAPYERGRRINDLLAEMDNITTDDFKVMLMDNFSYHAYSILPTMLERIADDRTKLESHERALIDLLAEWDYLNDGDKIEPSLFRRWWVELNREIWDNKFDADYPMRRPWRDITAELIVNEPDSPIFNNVQTDDTETLNDLLFISFQKAVAYLRDRFGESTDGWLWGYVNNTNLNHIGQIPGMGIMDLFTGGGAESINA